MAQRATSLGPKPSLFSFCFFFLVFFLCFPFFFLIDKKTCFPPKKGHVLFIVQCLPLFLFSLFGASPLKFPFSFFASLLLFSFFLPSCFSFSLSGSCFFFLLCLLFLFQDVLLFLLFCLLSCVVLNHNISFIFALHLVFWLLLFFCSSCFAILLFWDFWKPVKNISEKMEIGKTAKNEKCRKKRTFWQELLAQLCSQIVSSFLFCVSFNFAFLQKNSIKIGVSAPPQKKNLKLKSGPS